MEQEDSNEHGVYEKILVKLIQNEIRGHIQWDKERGEVGARKDVRATMRIYRKSDLNGAFKESKTDTTIRVVVGRRFQ